MSSEITKDEIEAAVRAAETARERMGTSADASAANRKPVRLVASLGAFPDNPEVRQRLVEQEREIARREQREEAARIDAAMSCIPGGYGGLLLDSAELATRVGLTDIGAAWRLVGAPGITFTGPSGSGKTTLASTLLGEVIRRERARRSYLWVAARDLATARRDHALGSGPPPVVRAASEVDLLLLDELCGEETTFASAVSDVICARYDAGRPTWVTTGFDRATLTNRYGAGVTRRVLERAAIVECRRRVPK